MSGSAESIPLPDGSVDAVLAGHALHWFDMAVAGPEIARIRDHLAGRPETAHGDFTLPMLTGVLRVRRL